MKKNLMIGIIIAVVLVIIAGFVIFLNNTKASCPKCPDASSWSDCKDGLRTRMNYKCDEKTKQCTQFEEQKTCLKCPDALQWSNCDSDNKKIRINYKYNETAGVCENFSEKADCPKLESRSMLWNWTISVYPNEGDKVKGAITAKINPRVENIVNAKKVRFELFKKGVDNSLFIYDVKLSSTNEAYYTLNTSSYSNGNYILDAIVYDDNNSVLDVANVIINIEN
jgi:hypothetical protein